MLWHLPGDAAAGLDEPSFVGGDDGLGAVAEVEFGEDARDVGFTADVSTTRRLDD